MMLKKKKTAGVPEPTYERQPVVTQVVEVVGEEPQSQGIRESLTESDENIAVAEPPKSAQFVPSELPVDRTEEVGMPHEERISDEREEHQKETVAELFKRPAPGVMPEITVQKDGPRKKNKKFLLLVVIILVVLLGGGLFVAKRKSLSFTNLFAAPTPTPTSTPTPTPTPQPVARGDIKVQVLNGGGVPGAASKMKSFLEDKGYTVSDVSNADAYTYDKTEVAVQAGKEAYQKLLMDDLKDTYSLATDAATLSSDVSYDARVVVGKE